MLKFSNKIINGDCLKELKKIPDKTFDLVFADPPYNMQIGEKLTRPDSSKVNGVNDKWDQFNSFKHYDEFCESWLAECKRVLTASGSIYIICPWESSSLYHSVLGKNFIIQSRITAERQIENTELSQWKNKISDIWFATKTNDYIFNQNYIVNGKNINNPKPEEIKDNLWFHLDYEEIVHRIVKASSFKLNWILDPFMNVGAVGVVAKKRGRRFIGFENNQDQILLAMKTINEREK